MRYWKTFFFAISITFCQIHATDLSPWLGNLYEFEFRPLYSYRYYPSISSGSQSIRRHSYSRWLNGSLGMAFPSFGLEAEILGAWTKRQKGNVDQIKLTGRYVWADDVAGDPISVVTGLSLIKAFHHSLHDVSSFHHGLGEAELFLSVGKEYARGMQWDSRWWGIFALGAAAERGSAWIRFDCAYEKRFFEKHEARCLIRSLWGIGQHNLNLNHFEGYGPIQHQSIDLAVRYTYLIDFFGSASLEYCYRVHARNFPEHAHQVTAQVLYTFGL